MKLLITTAIAITTLGTAALAEKSRVYPQCELVDKGGYFNLAPAGCSRVNWSDERDDSPTFADHWVGSPAALDMAERRREALELEQ